MSQHPDELSPPPALEIIVVPRPRIFVTEEGDMTEDAAAIYLSHRMRKSVAPRTLRYWRAKNRGPVFHQVQEEGCTRHVWYRQADLDEWLVTCAKDPLAA